MKRLLTITAVCLLGTAGFAQTSSNSSVVVRPITANYTATPPTVTFEVAWPAGSRNSTTHRSKVWVLVDYRRIKNNEYAGSWSRADITVPKSAITTTAGTVSLAADNTKGFWLEGPDDNFAFAATVTVPVTVDLNDFDNLFGWCGVASDRPPYAEEMSEYYALNGTQPFIIQTHLTNTGSAVSVNSTVYKDCIYGLTDATNSPDSKWPVMPAISGFTATTTTICAGQPVTLTAAATNAERYSFDNGTTWGSSSSIEVSPSTTTTYKLKATRIKGACTVTWPTEITITVHPTPDIKFVNPPPILCTDSKTVLTVNDLNSAGSSYCFTYECADCVHSPYLTGNDETASTGCYWFSECIYGKANTYTLPVPVAGTFTVWAKAITAYGCVDSVNTTATQVLSPTITHASGSTAQTITAGSAIEEIKYNTANATSATATGLPDGLSGTWNANVYTISGTPTCGTFNYTVTTTNDNSCADAFVTGSITVLGNGATYSNCTAPTLCLMGVGFASTDTYTRNNIMLSAPVTVTTCQKTSYSGGSSGAYQASCRTNPGYDGDYFSWCMVVQYASQLCPSPWRVPTRDDYCQYAGLSAGCRSYTSVGRAGVHGWMTGGYASGSSPINQGGAGYYWSANEYSETDGYRIYTQTAYAYYGYNEEKRYGYTLRCVQDAP